MITVKGTIDEIANVVQTISPGYPTEQLRHLVPTTWRYTVGGTDVRLIVTPPAADDMKKGPADAIRIWDYQMLVKELRMEAATLPNKFSQNDELFQILYDAAAAIETLTQEATDD